MGPTTCANQPQHLVASGVRTCVRVHYFLCPFVCLLVYPVQAVVIFYSYYCPKPPLYLSIHIYIHARVCAYHSSSNNNISIYFILCLGTFYFTIPLSLLSLFFSFM